MIKKIEPIEATEKKEAVKKGAVKKGGKREGRNVTELVFILDKSGSMGGLEADTIGGFNSMIEKQKKEKGEALVSTVLFSVNTTVLHDRADIKKIEPMTDRDYVVGGGTALLDAVGGAIEHIRDIREGMDKAEIPDKTIFIITTDGQENSSRIYTYPVIKKMIEKMQNKIDWEFMFLGANMDAVSEAARYGIKASRAATYTCDSAGTALNFEVLDKTVSKMRNASSAMAMKAILDDEDSFEEIRADNAKRGR